MRFPIEKYKYYFWTEHDADGNEVKCVTAASTYAGKTVRGVAKCHPTDTYDEEYGKKVAAFRCGYKIALKRMKRAQKRMDEVIQLDEDLKKFKLDAAEYYRNAAEELRSFTADNWGL